MPEPHPRYLLAFDTWRMPHHMTDVLVVGAGVAGLRAALAASEERSVLLVGKGGPTACNTWWAQGGIAAVLGDDPEDSEALHAADTCAVGQGLCDQAVVDAVVRDADARIEELISWGADFDMDPEQPDRPARGLEGGHRAARILHARGDSTGAEIRDVLGDRVSACESIEWWQDAFLVDLLTDDEGRCRGGLFFGNGRMRAVWAGAVVLCTGGYAQVFQESTNVPGATGDGVAAAWRAGALIEDMEFVQFHPTTLYLAGVPRLLITEAVRGEGAHVVTETGERFLLDIDERGELAPRDVISRAITRHLESPEGHGVYLDLRHLDTERLTRRFPGVVASCQAHGLDIAKDRIPIRPAAHYSIGGVAVDLDGRTDLVGLFSAGEVACSGLHGANRLASNSLLEGLVLGRKAGLAASDKAGEGPLRPVRIRGEGTGARGGSLDVDDLRVSLRTLLWRDAGIERHGGSLSGAAGAVRGWEGFAQTVDDGGAGRLVLLNMLCAARLMTQGALLRQESRGTHFRRDASERDDEAFAIRIGHRRGEAEPLRRNIPITDVTVGESTAR